MSLRGFKNGNRSVRSRRLARVISETPPGARPEAEGLPLRHPRSILAVGVTFSLLTAALLVDWRRASVERIVGAAMLVSVLNAIYFAYLFRNRREVLRSRARVALVSLLSAVALVFAALMRDNPLWPPYLVPVSAAAIVLSLVFHRRIALEFSWLLLLYVGLILLGGSAVEGRDVMRTLAVLAAGVFTSVLATGRIRTRSRVIHVGALIGLVQMLASAALLVLWSDSRPAEPMATHLFWAVAHGVLVGFLVSGSLPFFEYVFGISTDISLLELSNIAQQTVLRRLLVKAPGTYNHSLLVGMLAEEAAETIGANPLLARVGGYYHDIGKMVKPEYFGENEVVPGLHHRPLSPTMSTLIIKAHVKDGSELAMHHDLPRPIVDIIEQHHGTTLVEFFYAEAQKRARRGERVEQSAFRYQGPKPQFKEAGIVMIADSVEAATRSLTDPTPKRIEEMVKSIARRKLDDGQLDECGLTLKEVHLIEEAVTRVLLGLLSGNRRPRYPDLVRSGAARRTEAAAAGDDGSGS